MTPQIFQGDFQENTQMLLVQERATLYSGRSRAHLAVSTEFGSKQGRGALGVNRVHLLLWATQWQPV